MTIKKKIHISTEIKKIPPKPITILKTKSYKY